MTVNEVKRISDLITELLSFARSSIPSLAAVNVNEVVERVATLLEPEARKHNLTLTRALSANVPLVNADGDQIKQVLINLVLNAIQATEPGGVVSISSRTVQDGSAHVVQLEVRDSGAGIPPEQLDEIFNPFFTTKAKGTGLGLAIAHQIVTEHGGVLAVESKVGKGTSFFIDLPASVPDAAAAPEPQDVGFLEQQQWRRRKVAS
jgi:signal transduction histidine kinase